MDWNQIIHFPQKTGKFSPRKKTLVPPPQINDLSLLLPHTVGPVAFYLFVFQFFVCLLVNSLVHLSSSLVST